MTAIQHNEWADSMADWAYANADSLKEHSAIEADRREAWQIEKASPDWIEMQGRPAWPSLRNSPEMACWAPDDEPAKEEMTGAEAWLLMSAYIASILFTCWAFSMFAQYIKEAM